MHACRFMHAGRFIHAMQMLLMRVWVRGAYGKKCWVHLVTRAALGSPPIVKKKSSTRNFKFQVMETYLPNLRTFLAPNSSA